MSKRYSKAYGSKMSTPSKRPKLDVTITPSQQINRTDKHPSTSRKNQPDDDLWGSDFDDEDMEEMDFAATQAESKSVDATNSTSVSQLKPDSVKPPLYSYSNSKPSTSRSSGFAGSSETKKFEPKIPSKFILSRKDSTQSTNPYSNQAKDGNAFVSAQKKAQPSQMISSSNNQRDMFKDEQSIMYNDFTDNLLNVNNHNSTFQSQIINKRANASNGSRTNVPVTSEAINVSDDSMMKQLEKLQLENQKLFNAKEGETLFLRNKLEQTQSRAERDKNEKARQIEEQAKIHRSEINEANKKEETLRAQLDLQNLELNNLKERCKLLESGSVKLTQPHTARLDSVNKNRLNTTLNRSSPTVKTVQVRESGVQTASFNLRNAHRLRKTVEIYPLSIIPQSIFEPSRVEPSVVEIQVIEKVGTKNLPILQDEENIRIFENPDLVKPIVTMINDEKLNVEFCSPDVATLMKKTEIEINGNNMLPIMNKLVAVARELLLNTTLVLKRISEVIKNDDIRDMNDVYFSDFYKIHVDYTKSICDSNAWHDRERGIEAMRSLAILSYTAVASNYLSEYVAGKIPLNLFNDSNYEKYIKEMNSYNRWPKKGCEFEMLELILEFVSTVGYVRRSHQFSGLIIAITKLLVSVKERLIDNERGIDYVYKILKEIVFARPLFVCYTYITELLMTFSQCLQFCKRLCVGTNKTAMTIWKDELHFTSDACVMQIYVAQLEFYQPDPVEIIDITYMLVCFVSNILSLNDIQWLSLPGTVCKCSMKLFGLTLNFLYKCSKVNLDEPVDRQNYNYVSSFRDPINEFYLSNETTQAIAQNTKTFSKTISSNSGQLDKNIKIQSQHKQLLTIRKGIMFLCYLSTRDPDFTIRSTDIEDSFNLFMQQIESFKDLKLNETEQAALSNVKSTFFFDKAPSSEERFDKVQRCSGFKKHSVLKERPPGLIRQQIVKSYDDSTSSNQRISGNPSWLSGLMSNRKRK